jgi:beta-1,4-N-acetylglucosaminyltransferase
MSVQSFEYSPELQSEIDCSSFVILHCGAGSVLEVLHSKKRGIAVVNPNLLENHQVELADALESSGLMAVARSPDHILDVLKKTDWSKINTYAAPDLSLFPRELGTLIKLD